jgi:hypothetical protein
MGQSDCRDSAEPGIGTSAHRTAVAGRRPSLANPVTGSSQRNGLPEFAKNALDENEAHFFFFTESVEILEILERMRQDGHFPRTAASVR